MSNNYIMTSKNAIDVLIQPFHELYQLIIMTSGDIDDAFFCHLFDQ